MPATTGFSLNTTTGVVAATNNVSKDDRTATVTIKVTLNGKSTTTTSKITQEGNIVKIDWELYLAPIPKNANTILPDLEYYETDTDLEQYQGYFSLSGGIWSEDDGLIETDGWAWGMWEEGVQLWLGPSKGDTVQIEFEPFNNGFSATSAKFVPENSSITATTTSLSPLTITIKNVSASGGDFIRGILQLRYSLS